jgi:protein-tyrosine phosphatase
MFVCLGNICRSPAAEGILRHFVDKANLPFSVHVESCGLGEWHIGSLPDERMREAAKDRGVVLASRAQKFDATFLDKFDVILAADNQVLHELHRFAKTPEHKAKIHLITTFSDLYQGEEVPDPYYGGDAGFARVLDMLEDSCSGLIKYLKSKNLGMSGQ